jgi:hypothetical protein
VRLDDNETHISGDTGAPMSPAWVQKSPHVEDLELRKFLKSGNLTLAKAAIRWMSANLHQDRSHIGFD